MKTLTIISTAIIVSACALSTAYAAETESKVSLDSLVSQTVKSNLADASNSINIDLQKAVLTNSHNLFISNDAPKGKVKIIDLASVESNVNTKSDKAE